MDLPASSTILVKNGKSGEAHLAELVAVEKAMQSITALSIFLLTHEGLLTGKQFGQANGDNFHTQSHPIWGAPI